MKFKKNGVFVNDQTVDTLPSGAVELTDEEWNNRRSAYVPTAQELADAESLSVKSKLLRLDIESIRDIRAYIASKPDAPQILKDKEAAAIEARVKVK